MRNALILVAFLACSRHEPTAEALASKITGAAAVERAKYWDGRMIEFEGEAIQGSMIRGAHAWLNLLDDGTALGVWVRRSDLPAAIAYGSYVRTGDRLQVRGVFNRACTEHGGDLDIHAEALIITAPGEGREHPLHIAKLVVAAILLGLSGALFPVWIRREREAGMRRGKSRAGGDFAGIGKVEHGPG